MSNTIICTQCKKALEIDKLKRNCSNCFGCTGCERYTCSKCGEEIVVKEMKRANCEL